MFGDVVLLASDEGLINLYGALLYFAVYDDLVAEREDGEVAFDEVLLIYLEGFTVSDDSRALLGNKTHLIYGFFGADFIDDADEGVRDGDEDEKEVFMGADKNNHACKNKVDKIKDSESVF